MLKLLLVGVLAPLLLLGGDAYAGYIETLVYPVAVDSSRNATPFSVFITISDWEEMASQTANLRVTRTGSGSHFRVWKDSVWVSSSLYSNCPVITLDSTGAWAGWVSLKGEGVSSTEIKAYARQADTTEPQIEEEQSHSVMLLDGVGNSGWLEGHIFVDSTLTVGLEEVVVLAIDTEGGVSGAYLAETNPVDDGYPDEPGYFRVSCPVGRIDSLEILSLGNESVQGYTISSPPWVITPGAARSVDDSSACVSVSVQDTFGMAADTVTIPVKIDTATGLGVCAAEFTLSFDGDIIEFLGIDTSSTRAGDARWLVEYNLVDDTLHLAMAGSSDLSGSGSLISLVFSIAENGTIGSSSDLSFANLLFNEAETGPEVYGQDGVLTVVSRWGDVSGDGEVHAYDAALILKWLVDPIGDPLETHQLIVADADLDQEITAYDGAVILQWVVGGVPTIPHPGLRRTLASLTVADFYGHPGDIVSVPLTVTNGEDLYSVEAALSYDPTVLELTNVETTTSWPLFWHESEKGHAKFVLAGSEAATDKSVIASLTFSILEAARGGCTLFLDDVRLNNMPRVLGCETVEFSLLGPTEPRAGFYLDQNYPNPFWTDTYISFEVMKPCEVSLVVYNISGENVKVLADGPRQPGHYGLWWDGKDEVGRQLGSGIYFCRMDIRAGEAGHNSLTRKMSIIR